MTTVPQLLSPAARRSVAGALLVAAAAVAAPAKKAPPPPRAPAPAVAAPAKGGATTPAPSAPVTGGLKIPAAPPGGSEAPPAAAAAPPQTPAAAPTSRVIEAYTDPATAAPSATAPAVSSAAPASTPLGLWLGAELGVAAPLSVLGAGVKAGARLEYRVRQGGPLLASLGVGYERHTAKAARLFPGPGGGSDPTALENQNVLVGELGGTFEAWHDDASAVTAGLCVGLLRSWTQTLALGSVRDETGVGSQVAVDLGYGRHLGPIDAFVRARWSLRHSGAGARSNVIELQWYQSLGLVVGAGLPL